ncbi:MAG: L-serine ammonia-lyase, iron-sulfur-dependent, subunit alpha [Lachnospiraceae bacterium]|jgi:L-serine dehydratase|nr:L-serine ammonia-lyase, iron-sulfur-dependent, subunit alpha [Lachnospiraceae bacterium]
MKQHASIFNDVLGPIMVGPSSSHTAGSVRIGRTLRELIEGKIVRFLLEMDPEGSLAASYHTQCSDVGLVAGLLGMEADDERLLQSMDIAKDEGMELVFSIVPFPATHPNTYRMTLTNDKGKELHATALSVGGGMIEFVEIEGFSLLLTGGFYESLIFVNNTNEAEIDEIKDKLASGIAGSADNEIKVQIETSISDGTGFIEIIAEKALNKELLKTILSEYEVADILQATPCLPIASQLTPAVPFLSADELIAYAKKDNLSLWEAAARYESVRGGCAKDEVWEKMRNLVRIMRNSREIGLEETHFDDRILGCQSKFFKDKDKVRRLIPNDMVNEIVKSVSAIMECKSAMKPFVAAPTAGSCGGLPGTVLGIAESLKLSDEQIIKAMFAAGIVGVFISEYSTFAAEVAGCQAECGAGSGMTAAAIVQLMDGTVEEGMAAASMALQNILGMVCDPVAVRVEVPCLGKNIMCGLNAFASAQMALLGYDQVVPLDETIGAFDEVGRKIPPELRCTGLSGLSVTKSSLAITLT